LEISATIPLHPTILLIRLKSIGDVVLTLPACELARENFPAARICFLTSRENAGLARAFSVVDEVLALDRAALRGPRFFGGVVELVKLLRRLRAEKFSLVVDFQGYGETAILSWLTGAPERWGLINRASRRWAFTRPITRDYGLHLADCNLALGLEAGLRATPVRNEFRVPEAELAAAREFFQRERLEVGRPTLFIQPFTSSPPKNWPLERYLALAREWRKRGRQVIFGGGPAEAGLLAGARQEGFVVSAGTALLVTAGLIQLCRVTVGGVTGLLHLAVAMGRRVVMVSGYAAQEMGYPYQHRDWMIGPLAGPIEAIALATVVAACEAALVETGEVGRG
jgi:ADP-heptose:LPS heptosyltransferase